MTHTAPPTQDDLLTARRRLTDAMHAMHADQRIIVNMELAQELDAAWSAYDAVVLATCEYKEQP